MSCLHASTLDSALQITMTGLGFVLVNVATLLYFDPTCESDSLELAKLSLLKALLFEDF